MVEDKKTTEKKTEEKKKTLADLTPEQKKAYHKEKAEERKTPEFFKKNGEKRVNGVITALKRVSFMSRYNGTPEQYKAIMEHIDKAVDDLRHELEGSTEAENFTL